MPILPKILKPVTGNTLIYLFCLTVIISGDFGLSPDEHEDELGDGYEFGEDEYPEVSDWLSWRCIWVRRSMDKLIRSSGTVVMPDSLL